MLALLVFYWHELNSLKPHTCVSQFLWVRILGGADLALCPCLTKLQSRCQVGLRCHLGLGSGRTCFQVHCGLWQHLELGRLRSRGLQSPPGCPCRQPCAPCPLTHPIRKLAMKQLASLPDQLRKSSARTALPYCAARVCVHGHTHPSLWLCLNRSHASHHLGCVHCLEASPSSCSWGGA